MFWRMTMAIFRLYVKYLLNSYTKLIWAVGVVGTISRICHRGWEVWVPGGGGLCYYML